MDTNVTCPNCGQLLVVDSAAAGQQTCCPACPKPFVILPLARLAPSPVPATPATRTRNRDAAVLISVLGVVFLIVLYAVKHELKDDAFLRKARIMNSESSLIQIGLALRIWSGDHNEQFPFNISQAEGGTRELSEPDSNGFVKNPVPTFMIISNELGSPHPLACYDDHTKQKASDFASLTTHNISYLLRTGTNVNENNPNEILAVDPIHGLVLYCDGTVHFDSHYKTNSSSR